MQAGALVAVAAGVERGLCTGAAAEGELMSKPIYEDPTLDGAADPVVINRRGTEEWWTFYTNRRAAHPGPGVEWVHGSPIGVAVSADAGATWQFRGNVAGLDDPADPGLNTHWAPEIMWELGEYHMYLSYITGTPDRWPGFPRHIVHFTSPDLDHWTRHGVVPLASDYVIDAAVALCPDGLYRSGTRTRPTARAPGWRRAATSAPGHRPAWRSPENPAATRMRGRTCSGSAAGGG